MSKNCRIAKTKLNIVGSKLYFYVNYHVTLNVSQTIAYVYMSPKQNFRFGFLRKIVLTYDIKMRNLLS